MRQCTRKDTRSTSDEWPDINRILETALESEAALKNKKSVIPMTGTYSDNEDAREDGTLILKEQQSCQLSREESLQAPNVEQMDASPDYLFERSSPEDPVVIEDDSADEELNDGAADDELDGDQPERQNEGLPRIVGDQTYSFGGEDISLAIAQHFVHLRDNRGTSQETVLGHEENPNDDLDVASPYLSTQRKRKRSRSTDTETYTGQTSDPTLEQCPDNTHVAKRHGSLSSRNNSVSDSISTREQASASHSSTHPQFDSVNSENSSHDDGNDVNGRVSGDGNASNKESRVNHDEDGGIADNRTPAKASAVIPQPDLTDSEPRQERITEDALPQDAAENRADRGCERPRKKSRQQPSSTTVGVTAQPAKPLSAQGGFLSSAVPTRPSVTKIGVPSCNSNGDRSPRLSRQQLTHITLRPISSGVSFLGTIIQDDRKVPTFSYSQSVTLVEDVLGDVGHIDGVNIMPLALNLWLLTGFLYAL